MLWFMRGYLALESVLRTTGVFTLHEYDIPFKNWNKAIKIIPFGDVHWGAPGCDADLFMEELHKHKGDPDVYYLGMGDYFDIASTSERRILESIDLHESTKQDLDDLYRMRADSFMEQIRQCQGRIIGMVEGNHYARLESGVTTTQYMCEQLKCKYLGVMSAIRVNFTNPIQKGFYPYDIVAHHGMGAARLHGGSINRVSQIAEGWIADCYFMGHDHKAITAKGQRVFIDKHPQAGLRLKEKTWYSARTGGYLKGYIDKRPTYQADACSGPLALGGIELHVTPTRRKRDKVEVKGLTHRVLV